MSNSDFEPMLASAAKPEALAFPLMASPKLDGIRCCVVEGRALTRKLKPVPNLFTRTWLEQKLDAEAWLDGLDGELLVGPPTAKDAYLQTVSGVMSHQGEPEATFWVFDLHDMPAAYVSRYEALQTIVSTLPRGLAPRVQVLPQRVLQSMDELVAYESEMVELGYEGVILRKGAGHYKFGRSTLREGLLLKLKRFEDSECRILAIEEEMHNTNAAQTNELGRTKRSTAKAGLVGKGTMGALVVEDIHHGWRFNIGSGFTAAQRAQPWKIGSIHKYKYFPVGMKDVPRHPVYIGPRSKFDL